MDYLIPLRKEAPMSNIPQFIRQLFQEWSFEFSVNVWPRFQLLMFSAIVCAGRHTICAFLRIAGTLAPGHWSSYHRVLSMRCWSSWRLARILAGRVIARFVPSGVIQIEVDDTVTEHPGRKVYGKGCHRDAVRSSHSYTAWRWGHKWVTVGIQVRLPLTSRPWVLPILCALYLSPAESQRQGRKHKTPIDLARQLLCVLMRWFPQRKFRLTGDGGYASHEFAVFVHRYSKQLDLVSKFPANANLYSPPPEPKAGAKGKGRPRKKGQKQPSPQCVVAKTEHRAKLRVSWYGGSFREVEVVTGTGYWYKGGQALVPVRWVYVKDLTGTHRDEYFYSTNLDLSALEIVETYTGRWNIEVTYEEVRAYLGLETTRGRCQKTILRTEPCLFGLYTLVALWFAELPENQRRHPVVPWTGRTKKHLTFSDAITIIRRQIWQYWIFETPAYSRAFQKLNAAEKRLIIHAVTQTNA